MTAVRSHFRRVFYTLLPQKGLINIENKILEFIHRRFPIDCNWLNGNCYYFSVILKNRFPQASLWYDVVLGHFVTLIDGKYYDWTGIVEPDGYLVKWNDFDDYDSLQKQTIVRDCII